MVQRRTPRWRRRVERQRAKARRVIGAGAIASLVVGVGAELVVIEHTPPDIEGLVRLALLMPSAIFLVWWALVPAYENAYGSGLPAMAPETAFPGAEVVERMAAIESTFDAAAVPAARSASTIVAPEVSEAFRRSVRVPRGAERGDIPDSFGLGSR